MRLFAIPALGYLVMAGGLAAQATPIVIRGGTVLPVSGPPIPNGIVLMQGGKIKAVGASVPIPSGAQVVDATGKFVIPGVIDAASHIGIGDGDLNEASDPMTPGLRAIDSYNPFGNFGSGKPGRLVNTEMLSGGVTTIYIAPADGTLLGGQGAVVKTAGATLDAIVVREPAAMDLTLGTPPKSAAREKQRDPYTRMAEVAMLRQLFIKAQEYQRSKKANAALPRDLGMEALGRLLAREFPARIQANAATDIRSALSLGQEFGFDMVIDGAAGAWDLRNDLLARRIPVVLGQISHPYVSNEEIPDTQDYPPVDEHLAGKLTGLGIRTAIATFSRAFVWLAPAGSGKWLLIDAGIAAGFGMSDADVLKAVTLVPAQILGVDQRVGSLEVGKDADVVILDGPPLSVKTWVTRVYLGGELVYQK